MAFFAWWTTSNKVTLPKDPNFVPGQSALVRRGKVRYVTKFGDTLTDELAGWKAIVTDVIHGDLTHPMMVGLDMSGADRAQLARFDSGANFYVEAQSVVPR
jgi:hypothetical protein